VTLYDGLDNYERQIWHAAEAEGQRKGIGCGLLLSFVAFVAWQIVRWWIER
jgi:hypothetical protein